ncbi:lycopene cyclase domain-containing protein [Agromyces sp. MMS24-JH15]|uniref:lycopene cyclase domain-containing protein n=1 Tax=Agromyces sp. MMS24-JH15 TaxID=3243765 RepID=UPI00374A2278
MSVVYLAALLASIVGMLLIDRRFRLFFWAAPARATVVFLVGWVFLLAWDAAGIALGIFLRGDNPISTGILLAPEFPLEEPVFLAFLCLVAMVAYTGALRIVAARRGAVRGGGAATSAPDAPAVADAPRAPSAPDAPVRGGAS